LFSVVKKESSYLHTTKREDDGEENGYEGGIQTASRDTMLCSDNCKQFQHKKHHQSLPIELYLWIM